MDIGALERGAAPIALHVATAQDATPEALLATAWQRVRAALKAQLGADVYSSWFARLELDRVDGATAHLTVPTRFLTSWIQAHYADKLAAIVIAEFPGIARVSIGTRSSARPAIAQRTDMTRTAPLSPCDPAVHESMPGGAPVAPAPPRGFDDIAQLFGSPLDARLTFDSFFVGRSNQLAHAAALRTGTTEAGEPLLYSPLYLHAAVGLGKTHLLQAIAHAAKANGRRTLYMTAERFMYGFMKALKAQTASAFRETLATIDCLLIDDFQFLQGKTIRAELGHALNAVIDAKRQVVIAADRGPADLEALDAHMRSRLAGGLAVEIARLDEDLRAKLLGARVAFARRLHPGFALAPEVVAHVAQAIDTNGRDLDGAVNRLVAQFCLTGEPLTVDSASHAIRDLVRAQDPRRIRIEDIQKIVATHFNVSKCDILSSRRTANVVRPRQIAMYLSKVLTLRSLPEIGRRFGGRDHTTVLHAVRKIEALSASDAATGDELRLLKMMLLEA